LGKFGSFLADALINQPYGLTYEIDNKTINIIPPPAIEELGKKVFFLKTCRSPGGLLMMMLQRIPMQRMSLLTMGSLFNR